MASSIKVKISFNSSKLLCKSISSSEEHFEIEFFTSGNLCNEFLREIISLALAFP
ncbi:hypothetical protein D3C87_1966060 [compost metagenome]